MMAIAIKSLTSLRYQVKQYPGGRSGCKGTKGPQGIGGLSWVFRCFFKWSFRPNGFEQPGTERRIVTSAKKHKNYLPGQWKGFTPVWILLCLVNSSFLVKAFPQEECGHRKGLSPVWILTWPLSCPLLLNPAPHSLHRNFFGRVLLSLSCSWWARSSVARVLDNLISWLSCSRLGEEGKGKGGEAEEGKGKELGDLGSCLCLCSRPLSAMSTGVRLEEEDEEEEEGEVNVVSCFTLELEVASTLTTGSSPPASPSSPQGLKIPPCCPSAFLPPLAMLGDIIQ